MSSVTYHHLYYIKEGANPIVVRPKINRSFIEWDNMTERGGGIAGYKDVKVIPFDEDSKDAREIQIETSSGKMISLVYVTLEIYNRCLKDRVAGKPEFSTEEELQKFYLDYYLSSER